MVNYDNLSVYKTSYDMLLQVFEIVKKFERDYKYTLWESIKKESIKIITLIYRANSSFEKRKVYLWEARESVEVLKLYFRLSKDFKVIALEKFVSMSQIVDSLSKQLVSWQKSV